jgi:hypothetical protein
MNEHSPTDIAVILLSTSFLAALIIGALVGKLASLMLGVGAGMLTVSAMAFAALWIHWRAGDEVPRGYSRIEGIAVIDPAPTNQPGASGEALTNHDFVIRYRDAENVERQFSGAYAATKLMAGQRVVLDYRRDSTDPPHVVDSRNQHLLRMTFLLFGAIPLTMAATVFVSAWEDRCRFVPRPRSNRVKKICSIAHLAANLGIFAGFVTMFWDTTLASTASGFKLIGYAAAAHALVGIVAGARPWRICAMTVVATGFGGFGWFATLAA